MSDYNFIDSNIPKLFEKFFSLVLYKPGKKGLNRDFMPWPIFCSLICPMKKEKYKMQRSRHSSQTKKKSFEVRFNNYMRCMEICILDREGMYPLIVKDPEAEKLYCIEKTRRGGLKMSAV